MTWFKVDDSFPDHPKVKSIPRAIRGNAIALWTMAGSWCSRQLTDGVVMADMVEDLGRVNKDAQALVTAGLWHAPGHGCSRCPAVPDGCYLFHDFLQYNPSREKVLAERAAATERQKRARDRAKEQRDNDRSHGVTAAVTNSVTTPVSHDEVHPVVTGPPTRPDPTRSTYVGTQGGSSVPREPQQDPPPDTCPDHPSGTTAPCGPCGRAKRARADWDAAQARRRSEATSTAAKERAGLRRVEVDACGLCDGHGYRLLAGETGDGSGGPCDHVQREPGAKDRAFAAITTSGKRERT